MEDDATARILNIYNKRFDLLCATCDGMLDKQAIVERIDSSRPTVDRAFRELEDAGVLTSTGTEYELTNFGELLCQQFTHTRDVLDTLTKMKEVLSLLPRDSAIDMRLLERAEVYQSKEYAPQEPFLDVVDIADTAAEITGYSSTIMPSHVDMFYSLIVTEETGATLVFTTDVIEILEENYPDKFAEVTEADHTEIYGTPTVKMYGLLMADDTVAVPMGGRGDRLEAVIVNDTDAALEWGVEYFEDLISPEDTYKL